MAEPCGVALELRPLGLVALHIGQTRYAMSLQAPMQRRSRQVRDGWLQGIKAVIQWRSVRRLNATIAASSASDRTIELGSYGPVFISSTVARLRHFATVLELITQLPAQLRERSLRSLYCCSDSVRGRGASVTNLSHRAPFHSKERIALLNLGIKHRTTKAR